ncbi:hypothetical protein AOCH_000137 [Aspergillus ochraceoroseus]|uniref:Uncharacterized protein n=1 Tax=Aspergillus ochraceoroseus TaxID=138278 RepID=A0A0F8UPL6_9EURO|nr:hypothetical protein AOCH_000137 [Aspergillus ochraceoroseus]
MLAPRNRKSKFCFLTLTPRRLSTLVLVGVLYLVFHRLPSPPPPGDHRWLPDYDVGEIPRFLHRSPYRESPDREYESSVSEALRRIEQRALAQNGRDLVAEERIWQIRIGKQFTKEQRGSDSHAFEEKNHEWKYTLVTDDEAHGYISSLFSTVPDLENLYNSYPYDVLRSDLLRYLILWYFGGYYADMDVFPAQSIKQCRTLRPILSDLRAGSANISLLVGVEIDEPYASTRLMHDWRWIRRYGLIQYTMYAPQRFSPFLREAVVRVLAHTRQHHRSSIPILGPTYSQETILEVTGPGVFTDAVLDVLSNTLPPAHPLVASSVESDLGIGDLIAPASGQVARRVTWAPFHKIREPVCVDAQDAAVGSAMGGLCVLPVSVWGNGQRHSGAENFQGAHACVNHRFGGSWKKEWWRPYFG